MRPSQKPFENQLTSTAQECLHIVNNVGCHILSVYFRQSREARAADAIL